MDLLRERNKYAEEANEISERLEKLQKSYDLLKNILVRVAGGCENPQELCLEFLKDVI